MRLLQNCVTGYFFHTLGHFCTMCVNILQCHICCLFLPGMKLGLRELFNWYRLKQNIILKLPSEESRRYFSRDFFRVLRLEELRQPGFLNAKIS